MKNSKQYQEITATIVTMLKDGTKPWESPWVGSLQNSYTATNVTNATAASRQIL